MKNYAIAMQMRIKMTLSMTDGTAVSPEIYNTIHKMGKAPVASIK